MGEVFGGAPLLGYTQYFQRYLGTMFSEDGDRAAIEATLPAVRDWYVQAGAGGMTAADKQNRNALLLGGMRKDNLTRGTGVDLLVGQDGDDFLAGGGSADTLLGGQDNDRLLGDTLTADASDPHRWRDSRGLIYDFTGTWGGRGLLTIRDPAATGGNAIQLRNWQSGELGLSLAPPVVIAKSAKNGDGEDNILAADSPIQRVFGFGGADRIRLNLAGAEGWGGLGDDWMHPHAKCRCPG